MNINSLKLNFTLCSVGDIVFFADSRQIQKVSDYTGDEKGICIKLNEVFGFESPDQADRQVVFSIKCNKDIKFNIITDRILDSVEIDVYDIKPLPPLVEKYAFAKGIWGMVSYRKRMVFIVDFLMLLAKREERNDN
jgi:chemotaxis signal transduction protein